jgi:hypothetical protein
MTDAELETALAGRPRHHAQPSTVRPLSESLGCSDEHAATYARAKGLIDADNQLHCWHCRRVCDWHVSLHCDDCRASAPARKREQERRERESRRPLPEQSGPPRGQAERSFRDGY